jgi:hypothetical protein
MSLLTIQNLVSAFAILGLVEAIIKPIAKRIIQYKVIKYGPLVFKALDPVMPELIKNCSSEELERIVRDTFSTVTGEDWSTVNIDNFWQWYDPRKNADAI